MLCLALKTNIDNINQQLGKDVQVAGMVVNSAGDFNAIFCDTKHDGMFYKIDDINLEGVGNLPSYKGKSLFRQERYFGE